MIELSVLEAVQSLSDFGALHAEINDFLDDKYLQSSSQNWVDLQISSAKLPVEKLSLCNQRVIVNRLVFLRLRGQNIAFS